MSLGFNLGQTGNATEVGAGVVKLATQLQVDNRQADDGGVPLVITPDKLPANGVFDFVAKEDLTAGQPVGVSSLFGGVARAHRQDQSLLHGISSPINNHRRANTSCTLSANKAIYLAANTASLDTLFAQVIEYDTDTLSATLGTAATVTTGFVQGGPGGLGTATICKLDTDKFIVFYVLDNFNTTIRYKVGIVTGTTVAFGAEGTVAVVATTLVGAQFTCGQMDVDKGVLWFTAATASTSGAFAFTTSGTTATFGGAIAIDNNMKTNSGGLVALKIATDKFVLLGGVGSSTINAQVGTLSGVTATMGARQNLYSGTSAADAGHFYAESPADNVFVLRFSIVSTTPGLFVATVSGTVITVGTVRTDLAAIGYGNLIVKGSDIYLIGGGNVGFGTLYKLSFSGTTISGSTYTVVTNRFFSGDTIIYDQGTYFAGFNPVPTSTQTRYWIEGMSGVWTGIAQETVAKGATVKVLVAGIDANQTGLIPGALYRVNYTGIDDTGALVMMNNITAGAGVDDLKWGTAISDTEIVI